MHKIFATVAITALAGCQTTSTPDAAAGNYGPWKVKTSTSRLDDKASTSLVSTSTSVKSARGSYRDNVGVLGVSCSGVQVLFGGIIGGNGNAVVSVRVDGKPARSDLFTILPTFDTVSASGQKGREAIKYLVGGQNLYVEVSSLTIGRTSGDFNISNLADAMAGSGMDCQ